MQKFNTIICIGNGNELASAMANQIATQHNIDYHGILEPATNLLPGGYHTSIYDIKLPELVEKITGIQNLKIVVLDQGQTCYNDNKEFYDTLEFGQALHNYATVEFINLMWSNSMRQILETNKSFCILPFMSINYANKIARHCCWMKPIGNNYTDFENNPGSVVLRKKMLAGEKDPVCAQCYRIEDVGGISQRQVQSTEWSYRLGVNSLCQLETKLIHYEIPLGNQCNLLCRMCNPASSNLIDQEYTKIGLSSIPIGITAPDYFDRIDMDTVQKISIAGGEPTINDNFIKFLERCIELARTDIEISITTNCVSLPRRFLNLIPHFKNFRCSISVDGFDQLNHYIRWPTQWTKLTENIQELTQLIKPCNYNFNTTVSIYNISQLYNLFNFLETTYPGIHCEIIYLEEPSYQQASNYPNKETALAELKRVQSLTLYQKNENFKKKIDGLVNLISNSTVDYKKLQAFYEFNDRLDASRCVKLADYIPELEQCRDSITNQI
jgi:MoaA/NifB/PqqE/SkfB family radical SAM enzyme